MYIINKWQKQTFLWNEISLGSSERSLATQSGFVHSEIRETLKGITELDHREILDGVCDVFFTAIQIPYILHQRKHFDSRYKSGKIDFESHGNVFVGQNTELLFVLRESVCRIGNFVQFAEFAETSDDIERELVNMLQITAQIYGWYMLKAYMEAVIASNYSKFVPAVDLEPTPDELSSETDHNKREDLKLDLLERNKKELIAKFYAADPKNAKYKDVAFVESGYTEEVTDPVYILKTNNGNGKVVKHPDYFSEVINFLPYNINTIIESLSSK